MSTTNLNPQQAADVIIAHTASAIDKLNAFTAATFQTRGGRIGSGMGGVIEALWGFYLNQALRDSRHFEVELAWIYGHEYNDFACITPNAVWEPDTRQGELLRIEAKSMVATADESKAHFDRLVTELEQSELLAVFLWHWEPVSAQSARVFPKVRDHFIGSALSIARLRDELHLARGGTFVSAGQCADKCRQNPCAHVGEPLNASGIRERRTGPESTKGKSVSYAANFGGLLRMLGSRGGRGADIIRRHAQSDASAQAFVTFMARHFPRVARYGS